MALPDVARLRRLTEESWAKRSRDTQGLVDRVNLVKHSVLRRAEEAARIGFREVSAWVMTVRDADDVEVLEQTIDELREMGFTADWTWTDVKINDVVIRVSWSAQST